MFGLFKRSDQKVINVNDIEASLGKINLIDIREVYEYKAGSIKGSKNIPMNDLLTNASKYLDKGNTYYIMCQSGGRSSVTCKNLTKQGFDVINVAGGFGAYIGTKKN
jgi:rhodanese-related sulfurtransferase